MKRRLVCFLKLLALVSLTAYLSSSCVLETQNDSKGSEITDKAIEITDKEGKSTVIYEESHALVIWAGNYQHSSWGKLNNVEVEAKEVVNALEHRGFKVTTVGNPTGESLRNAIKNFFDNYGYKPDNRLVIFFTGHGHTRNRTKGYLVPVDAPDPIIDEQSFLKYAFSMQQMMYWAREIEAKHVLFVFDSCFSGTVFKTKARPRAENAYIRDVIAKPVRQFIAAGDADQEVPAKSIFTPLFIRGLEGEADYTGDGYVTGSELGLYLTQTLSKYTSDQTPQYGKIRDVDLDRGDIVFRSLLNSNITQQTNVEDLSLVRTITGHSDVVNSIAVTPNGQKIVSGSWDGTVKIWGFESGNLLHTLKPYNVKRKYYNGIQIYSGGRPIRTVIITSDGQNLIKSGDSGIIEIINLLTEQKVHSFSTEESNILSIALSPNEQSLASGSLYSNIVKIWNPITGQLLRSLQGHRALTSLAISPNSQTLVSGSADGTVQAWNLSNGELYFTNSTTAKGVWSVAINPKEQTFASGNEDGTINIWNLENGELILTLSGHKDQVWSVSISPDGKTLASGSQDKTVKIWNLATGELIKTLSGHSASVRCVTFSRDGNFLLSGSGDRTIKIWRLSVTLT